MELLIHRKGVDRAEKIQLMVAYLLQILLFLAAIYSFVENNWFTGVLTIGILIFTFLPSIIRRNYRVFLPIELDLLAILFIVATLFLGELHGYYTLFWWWDSLLHISSGLLLGMAGFMLVYTLSEEKKVHLKMKPGFVALFALVFAIAIGAVWEIFEFSMDTIFGFHMQTSGLIDTMGDLIVDTLGALIISVLGYFFIRKKKFFLFDRLIHRFIERNPHLFIRKKRD